MTANLIDEIEKYIPKSMALYDKELLLDNIKIILDEHKFTPPTSLAVNGVDELIEKRENEKETDNKDWCYKYDWFYDMFISDLKALKQTPVKDSKPKEVKPIYDAKDPESNRKHIIEDMC